MKAFGVIVFLTLIGVWVLIDVSRPDVPNVSGISNFKAGLPCLENLDKEYNPDYFDVFGRVKVWYARKADYWGLPMSPDLLRFFLGYIDVEMKVECFNLLSNSAQLNMDMAPGEFKAVYNSLAQHYALNQIP